MICLILDDPTQWDVGGCTGDLLAKPVGTDVICYHGFCKSMLPCLWRSVHVDQLSQLREVTVTRPAEARALSTQVQVLQ